MLRRHAVLGYTTSPSYTQDRNGLFSRMVHCNRSNVATAAPKGPSTASQGRAVSCCSCCATLMHLDIVACGLRLSHSACVIVGLQPFLRFGRFFQHCQASCVWSCFGHRQASLVLGMLFGKPWCHVEHWPFRTVPVGSPCICSHLSGKIRDLTELPGSCQERTLVVLWHHIPHHDRFLGISDCIELIDAHTLPLFFRHMFNVLRKL